MKRLVSVMLLCATFIGMAAGASHADQTIQVAAAADLAKLFDSRIIPAFKKKTGIVVLATFAATGLLQRQMESGAPYQVFISADVATPQKLAEENILDPASVKVYAVGQLVLWSKSLRAASSGMTLLTDSRVKEIAVANPKTAPYGTATIQSLTKLKLLPAIQDKIVYSENILQALQFAQSGNADLAFTALSLVKGQSGGSYTIVPPDSHAPIEQSVGFARNAGPSAQRFEAFLMSKPVQAIFRSAGFLPPPKAAQG